MKAIIETGGKQYSIQVGDVIYVEKLDVEEGKKVVFDKVLMANGVIGNPCVKGVSVEGKVVKNGKGKNCTILCAILSFAGLLIRCSGVLRRVLCGQ